MKTNQEQIGHYAQKNKAESGSALIYVLIAIALFAALSFTLSRQTDTGETRRLSSDRADIMATQLISTAAQVKSAIDQMFFTGSQINDLNFELPSDANFEIGSPIHKVFHPSGGGIIPPVLSPSVMSEVTTDPPAGWYLGRFNNIEWSQSSAHDVILVAYQINRAACEHINKSITGSMNIPNLNSGNLEQLFIDVFYHSGANVDITTGTGGNCEACHNQTSLCISNSARSAYAFYTVIANQ